MKNKKIKLGGNYVKEVIEPSSLFVLENNTIQVVQRKLVNFLGQLGYGVYAKTSKFLKGKLVKVQDQSIREVNEIEVRKDVLSCLVKSDLEDVYIEKFQKSIGTVLSKTQIYTIEDVDVPLLKDSQIEAYFPFADKVVKVTADAIEYIEYHELQQYVFEKQKKNFSIAMEGDGNGDFKQFCKLVTNNNEEWFLSLQTTIGYLLLSNKDAIEEKAVITYDYNLGKENEANGGSGKSLIFHTAIGQLKNVTIIDGKRYDPRSTRFMYQNVEATTNVILIDDVNDKFNFSQIYSAVTNGFDIEKKGKQAIRLEINEAPKFVITSNRLLKVDEGSSARRRMHEMFIYNHFNAEYKPVDEFGKGFFAPHWNDAEFNKFYYFMFECVQLYIQHGLKQYIPHDIKKLKLKGEIGENWNDFFDEYLFMCLDNDGCVDRRDFEEIVIEEFPFFTAHSLTKKLKKYCQYNNYTFDIENSGGVQTFKIVPLEKEESHTGAVYNNESHDSKKTDMLLDQLNRDVKGGSSDE